MTEPRRLYGFSPRTIFFVLALAVAAGLAVAYPWHAGVAFALALSVAMYLAPILPWVFRRR